MPIYEYRCTPCGLHFEKLVRRRTSDSVYAPCPKCGEPASKQVSAASFSFAHTPKSIAPANTGVHGIDFNYDIIIGRDAAAKHRIIEKRQERKREILRQYPGKTGYDLSRTPDGRDYYIMNPEKRRRVEAFRNAHNKIVRALHEMGKKSNSGDG